MQPNDEQQPIVFNANYVLFVIGIVVLSLFNGVLILFPMDPAAKRVILIIDGLITSFLLLDFVNSILKAPDRRQYMVGFHGWMVLLGSMPVPGFRLLRLLQFYLVGRKLRRSDFQAAERVIVERRAMSTLLAVVFVAILVFEFAGVSILNVENGAPDANIHTASDALWWSYVTITTVGYGDKFPVTQGGRLVGIVLMAVGIGLYSVVTGFLADWFRRPKRPRRARVLPVSAAVGPEATLSEVRALLDQQEREYRRTVRDLRARIDDLEKGLARPG